MKHTELRSAVLDALEKHDTGATLFDGRPAVFDEADFPAIAVYLTGAEYTGEELDSDTWQAELHIEVFLKAGETDSALDGAGFRAGFVDGVPDLSGDERCPGTVRFDHQYGGQWL